MQTNCSAATSPVFAATWMSTAEASCEQIVFRGECKGARFGHLHLFDSTHYNFVYLRLFDSTHYDFVTLQQTH